jgi:hypothetical protein
VGNKFLKFLFLVALCGSEIPNGQVAGSWFPKKKTGSGRMWRYTVIPNDGEWVNVTNVQPEAGEYEDVDWDVSSIEPASCTRSRVFIPSGGTHPGGSVRIAIFEFGHKPIVGVPMVDDDEKIVVCRVWKDHLQTLLVAYLIRHPDHKVINVDAICHVVDEPFRSKVISQDDDAIMRLFNERSIDCSFAAALAYWRTQDSGDLVDFQVNPEYGVADSFSWIARSFIALFRRDDVRHEMAQATVNIVPDAISLAVESTIDKLITVPQFGKLSRTELVALGVHLVCTCHVLFSIQRSKTLVATSVVMLSLSSTELRKVLNTQQRVVYAGVLLALWKVCCAEGNMVRAEAGVKKDEGTILGRLSRQMKDDMPDEIVGEAVQVLSSVERNYPRAREKTDAIDKLFSKVVTAGKISTSLLAIMKLLDYAKDCGTWYATWVSDPHTSVALFDRADALMVEYGEMKPVPPPAVLVEVVHLEQDMKSYYRAVNNLSARNRDIYGRFTTFASRMRSLDYSALKQPEPYICYLFGAPGIGKSAMDNILLALMYTCVTKKKFNPKNVYQWHVGSKYFDGYASQSCWKIDDATFPDSEACAEFVHQWKTIMSSDHARLNMADVVSKGVVYSHVDVALYVSNHKDFVLPQLLDVDKEALNRRVSMKWEVVKVSEPLADAPMFSNLRFREHIDGNVGDGITWQEFTLQLAANATRHAARRQYTFTRGINDAIETAINAGGLQNFEPLSHLREVFVRAEVGDSDDSMLSNRRDDERVIVEWATNRGYGIYVPMIRMGFQNRAGRALYKYIQCAGDSINVEEPMYPFRGYPSTFDPLRSLGLHTHDPRHVGVIESLMYHHWFKNEAQVDALVALLEHHSAAAGAPGLQLLARDSYTIVTRIIERYGFDHAGLFRRLTFWPLAGFTSKMIPHYQLLSEWGAAEMTEEHGRDEIPIIKPFYAKCIKYITIGAAIAGAVYMSLGAFRDRDEEAVDVPPPAPESAPTRGRRYVARVDPGVRRVYTSYLPQTGVSEPAPDIRKIKKNLGVISYRREDKQLCYQNCLALGGTRFLVAYHWLRQWQEAKKTIHLKFGENVWSFEYADVASGQSFLECPDIDLAVIDLAVPQQFPSIAKYVARDNDIPRDRHVQLTHLTATHTYPIVASYLPALLGYDHTLWNYGDDKYQSSVSDGYTYISQGKGPGMCGSVTVDQHGYIVSFHVAGYDDGGLAQLLTREMVTQYQTADLRDLTGRAFPSTRDTIRKSIHPQFVIGDIVMSQPQTVSRLVPNNNIGQCTRVTPGVPKKVPADLGWWVVNDTEASHAGINALVDWSHHALAEPQHDVRLDQFTEVYAKYLSTLFAKTGVSPIILTLDENVMGIPGQLSGIDLNKSAGFVSVGPGGLKSAYIKIVDNHAVLIPCLQELFDRVCRRLESGEAWEHVIPDIDVVFKGSMKDETLAVKADGTLKNARLFNAAPLLLLLLKRKYLGWLMIGTMRNSVESMLGVGMNPVIEWQKLGPAYDGKKMLAIDFKGFDKSVSHHLKMCTTRLVMAMLEHAGGVSQEHMNAALALLKTQETVQVAFGGVRLMFPNGVPSGDFGTTFQDGVAHVIAVGTAFECAMEKTFDADRALARLLAASYITYGDDGLGVAMCDDSLLPSAIRWLGAFGLTATSGNKTDEPMHSALEDVDFIGRSFVFDERWLPALKKVALENILAYRWSNMTEQRAFMESYKQILTEAALHGDEYFNTIRDALRKACSLLGQPSPQTLLASRRACIDDLFHDRATLYDGPSVVPTKRVWAESGTEYETGAAPQPTQAYKFVNTGHSKMNKLMGAIGGVTGVVHDVTDAASTLMSAFGFAHPMGPVTPDRTGQVGAGRFTADVNSDAVPLAATMMANVATGGEFLADCSVSQLGARMCTLGTREWNSTQTTGDRVWLDVPLSPGLIATGAIGEAACRADLPPYAAAASMFKFWRCDNVRVKVTVVSAAHVTGRLVIGMAARQSVDTVDLTTDTGSLVPTVITVLDISAQNELEVTLPWCIPQPMLLVCPMSHQIKFSSLPRDIGPLTCLGALSVQVLQPLAFPAATTGAVRVMLSVGFENLRCYGRRSDIIRTCYSVSSSDPTYSPMSGLTTSNMSSDAPTQNQQLAQTVQGAEAADQLTDKMLKLVPNGDMFTTERLARYALLGKFSWTGTGNLFESSLPDDINALEPIRVILDYAAFSQSDIEIRIQVSAPPTLQGCGYLVAVPLGDMYGGLAEHLVNSFVRITSLPHVRVLAGGCREYKLTLPYLGLYSSFPHSGITDLLNVERAMVGYRIFFMSMVEPVNVSAGTASVQVFIHARLVNPKVRVPVPSVYYVPTSGTDTTMNTNDTAYAVTDSGQIDDPMKAITDRKTVVRLGAPNTAPQAAKLCMGEEIDSLLLIMHAGHVIAIPPEVTTVPATSTGQIVYFNRSATMPWNIKYDSYAAQPLWIWLKSMFALHRGSVEIARVVRDVPHILGKRQQMNTSQIFESVIFSPSEDTPTPAVSQTVSLTIDDFESQLECSLYSQGGTYNHRFLTNTLSVRLPYYFDTNYVFTTQPGQVNTSANEGLELNFQPCATFNLTANIAPDVAISANTLNAVGPAEWYIYSAGDDYVMGCYRPIPYLTITQAQLESIQDAVYARYTRVTE